MSDKLRVTKMFREAQTREKKRMEEKEGKKREERRVDF